MSALEVPYGSINRVGSSIHAVLSTLRVKKVYFFVILVSKYLTILCHMSEDYNSINTVKASSFTVCTLQRMEPNAGWLIAQ
jgi:hypothetical protein